MNKIKILLDTLKLYCIVCRYEIGSFFTRKRVNCNKKLVLVLTPAFPPTVSAGVYRPMSWAKYAKVNGWEIDFLTKQFNTPPEMESAGKHLFDQIKSICTVYSVDKSTLEPSWGLSPRVDGHFTDALCAVSKALDVYVKKTPSIIVATGPSFDYFIAAYYLAKIYKVPLILDYRDEWTENPFTFVQKGNSDEFWERRIFKYAQSIIFTTISMKLHHSQKYGRSNNCYVVANGWEQSEHKQSIICSKSNPEKIVLMFVGVIGAHNSPVAFLKDIVNMRKNINPLDLEIHFIGKIPQDIKIEILNFENNIRFVFEGFLPRNIANNKMLQATALMLFNPPSMARYLPGKMFDYLATGKPVIVHGKLGETTFAIESVAGGYFVKENDIVMLEAVLKKARINAEKPMTDARKQWLAKYSREFLATKFFDILEKSEMSSSTNRLD